jgi:6-phosphofructokinase 1
MNACVARLVTLGAERGHEVTGFRGGYPGILAGDSVELRPAGTQGWYKLGGSVLKTGRLPSLVEEATQVALVERLRGCKIDALVIIGGDGSFRGALDLSARTSEVKFIGIPGTIDNNIYGSDYTLGHDTALNKLVSYIDDISDTGMALPGRVFFVETLGAFDSYLPQSAVLMGMADFSVLYEPKTSNEEIAQKVLEFRKLVRRDYVLATFAEGAQQMFDAADYVRQTLGLNVKCNLLGFAQRGGVPTACDRLHASAFALNAILALEAGAAGKYIVYKQGAYALLDFSFAAQKKQFDNYGFPEEAGIAPA